LFVDSAWLAYRIGIIIDKSNATACVASSVSWHSLFRHAFGGKGNVNTDSVLLLGIEGLHSRLKAF
jgi:hypothetical protein